jgi:single-strand DNA-binding protein
MLRVSLLGNMGADPELRYTTKGTQIASIRVAVNQVRTGPDGERQENTEWFRVRVSGPRADFAQRLSKGNRVLVIGRLDIGHYQSREGDTRTSFDVWADELQLIGPRPPLGEAEPAVDGDAEAAPQPVAGANGSGARGRGARGAAATESAAPADLEELPF